MSLLKVADSRLVRSFSSVLETLGLTVEEIGLPQTGCTFRLHTSQSLENHLPWIETNPSNRGVYCIVFGETKKVYVGQSKDVTIRLKQHLSDMRLGVHRNIRVQNLYNKHGESTLSFSWVLSCTVDTIDDYERLLISAFKKANRCLNFESGGNLNKTLSEDHRKKISAATMGRIGPNLGKKATAEARLNMSLSHIGKPSPRKGIRTGKPAWNSGRRGVQDSTRRNSVEVTDAKTGNMLGTFESIQHFCAAMDYKSKNYKKSNDGVRQLGRYTLRDTA